MFILLLTCLFIPFTTGAYSAAELEKLPPVDFCLANASKSDVIYYLFKSCAQKTAINLNEDYVLPNNDTNIPVKIFIHGHTSNVTTPWYQPLKNKYFTVGPHNIIYVDWSRADTNFTIAAANINAVGEFIADFIINLRVPLKNVHLIGHSLGSHVAGFVGKHIYWKTGSKVARITATDPAGPAFEKAKSDSKLDKLDAEFVDVVHTDMGYFGATNPIGHVDFYVNGGKNQPGCQSREKDENCSHRRSNDYFIESVNRTDVMAKAAKFNEKGEIVVSTEQDQVEFGDSVSTKTRGIYYLKTNSAPPFLISKKT